MAIYSQMHNFAEIYKVLMLSLHTEISPTISALDSTHVHGIPLYLFHPVVMQRWYFKFLQHSKNSAIWCIRVHHKLSENNCICCINLLKGTDFKVCFLDSHSLPSCNRNTSNYRVIFYVGCLELQMAVTGTENPLLGETACGSLLQQLQVFYLLYATFAFSGRSNTVY